MIPVAASDPRPCRDGGDVRPEPFDELIPTRRVAEPYFRQPEPARQQMQMGVDEPGRDEAPARVDLAGSPG